MPYIEIQPIKFLVQNNEISKAGFHMITDDRGSQIADDRKESCFHIIADNLKRSQSRLL